MNNMMWYIYIYIYMIWCGVYPPFGDHFLNRFPHWFSASFCMFPLIISWLYCNDIPIMNKLYPQSYHYKIRNILILFGIYIYIYTLLYQQHIMGYNPIKSPLYHHFLIHIFSLRFRPSPLTKGTWSSTTCAVPVWSPNGTLRFSTTRPGGGGAKTRHSLEIWSSDVCFTNTMNIHEYYSHKYHTPYLLNTIVCSL